MTSELQRRIRAVVIGGSDGAVDGLLTILPSLRAGFSLPILVVIHQPREPSTLLADLFASRCLVPVREAADKERVEPGTVYFAPRGYHLLVDQGPSLALSVDEPVHFSRPSIDVLFESAAVIYGKHLLGILLSGANEDGASGIGAIRRAQGATWIQDPKTAQSAAMPRAALGLGPADWTEAPRHAAQLLQTWQGPLEKAS